MGAGLRVSGAVYRQGDCVLLEAAFTDARPRKLLQSVGPISAPLTSPLQCVERLRQRVTGSLAAVLDPRLADLAGMTSEPPSYDAHREFPAGHALFSTDDSAAVGPTATPSPRDSSALFPPPPPLPACTHAPQSGTHTHSPGRPLRRQMPTTADLDATKIWIAFQKRTPTPTWS